MHAKSIKVSSLTTAAVIGIFLLLGQAGPVHAQSRPSMEDRLRTLEDREAIRQLLIDYGRTLDRRDFTAFSRLFAEDAEYVGGAATAVKGPAAIAKSLEEVFQKNPTGVRTPNFHLFANEVIQVNGDEAVAVSKGLFVVPNEKNVPEIVMLATYDDVFARDKSGWKFKRRSIRGDIPSPPAKKQ